MGSAFEETPEERLFKAALAFAEDEREAFVKSSAGDDEDLYQIVLELLDGYGRSGGDEKADTLLTDSVSRQRWGSSTEEPGVTIGPFTLVRQVGEGGMGTVWEAKQSVPIARRVALKLIKLGMDTAEVVQRFERERQTLALMEHPNIAAVYDAGATALGRPYFAMEFVEGVTITEYGEKHRLAIDERLRLMLTVCAGIEHAHRKGVIHRDLKPSNIIVSEEGLAKIIDFGIAKAAADDGGTLFTRASQMLGTPAYMSPEQASGVAKAIDTRSDVYSLGVVLYELLAGTPPFDPDRLASTGIAEMQKILAEEEPPTPSTRHTTAVPSDLSPPQTKFHTTHFEKDLDWIVMKAMAKEPERRYQTAAAFGEDLQRYLDGEAVDAVPPTASYRLGKFVRRNRLAVGAASAVLLALLAGLVISLVQVHRANQARAETTYTIADLYTNNGLAAARDGDAPVAALWFANAAVTAKGDPDRVSANQIRARTWRDEFPQVVRVLSSGFEWTGEVQWHPEGLHLMVTSTKGESMIACLETESAMSLDGAPEGLNYARWSHDGKSLVGNLGDSIVVLAFPSGEQVASVKGNATRLRWSPDDSCIAVVGPSDPFLWIPSTSQQVELGDGAVFRAIDFSPDGERILLHGGKVTVRSIADPTTDLFAPVTMKPFDYQFYQGDTNTGFLGPTADSFYLARHGSVEVRDVRSGDILETYAVPHAVPTLGASPDGYRIAIAEHTMIDRRRPEGGVEFNRNTFFALDWNPDGETYAAANNSHTFLECGFDHQTSKPLRIFGETKDRVLTMAYSPTGDYIAGVQLGGLIQVWKVAGGGVDPIVDSFPYEAVHKAVSPDLRHVLPAGFGRSTTKARSTRLFDLESGMPAGPEITASGIITNGAFSKNGRWCALGVATAPERERRQGNTGAGRIEFWDPFEGRQISPPFELPSEPRGLALHPDGATLAILCADTRMIELVFKNGDNGYPVDFERREIFRHDGVLNGSDFANTGLCRYSANGRHLIAYGRAKFLIWDRETEAFVETQTEASTVFATDIRGDIMTASLKFGEEGVGFWDLSNGKRLEQRLKFTRGAMFVRFDESGNHVLTDSYEGSAQVFDVARAEPIGPACPHDEDILGGDFIRGTPWIVSGSVTEGLVRFWDPRSGFEIRPPLPGNPRLVGVEHLVEVERLVISAQYIRAYATDELFPVPALDPASAHRLAEIDSSRRVRSEGGLDVIQEEEWLELWRNFRRDHPDFPGHALEKVDVPSSAKRRTHIATPSFEAGDVRSWTESSAHIANPSFEAGLLPPRPGYAPISGWKSSESGAVRTGVSPCVDGHLFADNGMIPEGDRVAFIQSIGFPQSLSTTITGLVPGSLYKVSFRANSRTNTVPPKASWSLNGADLSRFEALQVNSFGKRSAPYRTVEGTFLATSSTAALVIQNHTSRDSTLLIDDFRVWVEAQ